MTSEAKRKLQSTLIAIALVASPFALLAGLVFGMLLLHDVQGRCNTFYTLGFSFEAFEQIRPGDTAPQVLRVLGEPLDRCISIYYPGGGAAPAPGVKTRDQLPPDARIYGEFFTYTAPKKYSNDYRLIQIAIGADNRVWYKRDFVTD